MTYVDGNGDTVDGEAKITGIATKADAAAATTEVAAGTNVASVEKTTDETDKHTIYTVNAKGTEVTGDSNVKVTSTTNNETNVTSYSVKLNDVVNLGSGDNKVKIDGNERTVSGLSNTEWDASGDYSQSTKAATEAQLGAVNKQVNTNKTNIIELQGSTINSGNVDENGNINLTHKNADNTTSIITSIDGLKDYALKDGQYITKDKSGATILTLQDQYDPNSTKEIKIDGLVTYNTKTEDGEVTGIDYGNIRLVGGEDGKGTLITNLKDGYVGKESTDAVNGSQLYATNQKVDAGWKATVGETSIEVKPTEDEAGNNVVPTLNFAGDRNIDVTADKASSTINVSLKDNVVLGGKASNDPRVQIGGTNGTIMATKNPNSISATTTIDGGNIYVGSSVSVGANDDVVITDKNITGLSNTTWDEDVKNAVSDSVKGEDKTEATKAATQAQLLEATDNISSDVDNLNDFAVKYDKNLDGTVNKDNVTLDGKNGTQIHNVADGRDEKDAVNVGQLTAKTGSLYYGDTNHYVTNDEDLTVSIGKLDNQVFTNTTNITELQGSTIDSGNVDEDGYINLTHTNADNTTTTIASIDGLKDYALKDGQYITKDKSGATLLTLQDQYDPNNTKTVKIDGLVTYNTKTENGEVTGIDYDNIRLAGENGTRITNLTAGLIDENSTDAVNGSQLYAVQQEAGKHTTVTVNGGVEAPEDGSYTNKDGHLDGNLLLKQTNNDGQIQYDIKLNPDVNLTGEGENSDNRVWLSGSNGTITATTENNLPEKTTVINGGNVYVGTSISVGDKVEITDKDITGLSNTSWNGTTDDESRAATEGQLKDVSDTVNAGWTATDSNGASIVVNPENGSTLNFAGDRNIEVKANEKDGSIDVSLKDDIVLGGKEGTSRVEIGGTNGTIMATKDPNSMAATTTIDGGNVYVGSSISVGDKVEITDKDITGLSNTTWDGKTDDESRAATEGQLKTVSDTVNAGWTATDSNGNSIDVKPENGSTLNFAGDRNIEVKANKKDGSIDVSLKDDMVLGGKEGTSRVEIGGTNGTIMATKDPNSMAATTTIDGGNVYVGSSISVGDKVEITDKDITGLSNTEWNGTTTTPDRAATEGQLQQVSNDVNAGWIATDNNGSQVNITPDKNKLNFAGDKNIKVTANEADGSIDVSLKDDVVLGDYTTGGAGVLIGGSSGTISATNSITVGEDQGLVIDGQKKTINGLSNITWNKDSIVSGQAATEDQLQQATAASKTTLSDGVNTTVTSKTDKTDGHVDYQVNLNDNVTLGTGDNQININGAPEANDPALSVGNKFVVEQDGSLTAQTENSKIALGETQASIKVGDNFVDVNNTNVSIEGNQTRVDIGENGAEFRYGNEDVWGYTEIKGGQILTDKVVANDSMIIGDVSTGNYINIDGTTNTITGLSNTTWDDELAKQVANSEELQGTAATQGQLQQAVNEVAEVANAGWNAKAGGNTINVKPNETLNFEGDGNITVSATSGTSSELKFGLNHNITLDNVKDKNTMLVINTDGREGYIPDNYKDGNEDAEDFIGKHGGFAIYYANPSLTTGDMTGTFGVTTDGVVHAKDVISYYSASSGSQSDVIRYSLNDVGDIVTQIAHSQFDVTGMDYTVISSFKSEEDKEDPFSTPEGTGERTIGLAVREDGAVVIGAVVDENGLQRDELGIRINDDTIVGGGKDTITGLDNIEWTPPTNSKARDVGDTRIASMAATVGQLDDLYGTVAAYDVDPDGIVDYNHITLAGTPYGLARDGGPTPTGGTSITNVAYASGTDGSEAVNVDYLNDAINNAVKDGGAMSTSEKHLATNSGTKPDGNATYAPDADGNITISEVNGDGDATGNSLVISDVASKSDVGDLNYSNAVGTEIADGDTVTDAIGKLDNRIDSITDTATNADKATVTGGNIKDDGTVSLTQKDGTTIDLDGKLADSGVVQEGTTFDKETGTLTITSQDKYSGETSSVTVDGIASTEVVGATTKEDLATAYKDADKDGNATTEYITESGSMVEADVALDHAIQDVANTSYANDMVLSNRIDSVEKRLGNVEERIDKVGAMAAAIANLRTMGFDPEAPTEIAIGVGQYKSETGIAIGVFHYPNQDFMLSASLSSSGDELMGGIGATWKLGRKSAAERAKDEEARHLEQAEEMKKLAQQEKVKAQAQRHAKLLAERQQASQKNA